MQQTLEQTITISYGNATNLDAPNTGSPTTVFSDGGGVGVLSVIILCLLIIVTATFYFIKIRKSSPKPFRRFGIFTFLVLATAVLAFNLPTVSAVPSLTLAANQQNLTITIPEGGGMTTTSTTVTTSTANATGYALTAALLQGEAGISIGLRGGDVATTASLMVGGTPLQLVGTTEANAGDTAETTAIELTFTIDGTVTPGTKALKLVYTATDNEPASVIAPSLMQAMTQDYCQNHMTIYDGTNEEAILTLNDPRGDGQDYQVAKLADNKCWMLDNLKLGSTTGTLTLTSADTDIASDFMLPQVVTIGTADYDNPGVYGPIPGDTGSGATNYGYLYNWSAATAGESRTSHNETAGDAPYSICPAGWRLPTISWDENWEVASGDFPDLDRAFGGSGNGSWSGEPNIAKWQHSGPFKGVFAGYWWEGFSGQGGWGDLWSSSANPGWSDAAFNADFVADGVSPGGYGNRNVGFGVRCLLN